MKDWLHMLATYNAWVNRRLYDAVARLPDAAYRADRGAFFGSLHGTLNHLLIADLIWMHRFTGEGDEPKELDAILFEDFGALTRAREAVDARIVGYVESLDEARLGGSVRYRSTRTPAEIEQELTPLLLHFFNHQTHHRGQAHCLLTEFTGEAPSFDLLIFQRETGIGLVSGEGGDFSRQERRPSPRSRS